MKLETILLELKDILEEENLIKLDKLIKDIEKCILEEDFKLNNSDKKRLSAIKRVLNNKSVVRPILKAFTPAEKGVMFTDSYELYHLNNDYLPFPVAFNDSHSDEFKNEYLKEHDTLECIAGVYPNLNKCDNIIPKCECQERVKVNASELMKLYKITKKEGNRKFYKFKTENFGDMVLDFDYVKNLIEILKLDDDFELELHGVHSPVIVHNKDNELGLILPIRTF